VSRASAAIAGRISAYQVKNETAVAENHAPSNKKCRHQSHDGRRHAGRERKNRARIDAIRVATLGR
jgi:hypothetical protein